MSWTLGHRADGFGVCRLVVWCNETESVVMSEEHIDTLNISFVKHLIEKHNEALRISNKEHRELVIECYKEINKQK